ncbi:MAG TPA: hypothetical protein VIY90_21000 [Steroidobacteraceae bacterium]
MGKTTAVRAIEARTLAGVRCFYFDSVGVPTAEEMRRDHGGGEQWQSWATRWWLAELDKLNPEIRVAILDGQTRPSYIIEAAKSVSRTVEIVLLDCRQSERERRLHEGRGQPELVTDEMNSWADYLRRQADALRLPIVDTTRLATQAVADRLVEVVDRLLALPA